MSCLVNGDLFMGRDVEGLQTGGEAKFNAHISILERINERQIEADKFSCIPSGDFQLMYYNCVRCVERIMWAYFTDEERQRLNELRPQPFLTSGRNPMNGKSMNSYSHDLALKIGNWEIAINSMIAKRGLALKSGKDPSMAMID